MYLQMKIIIIFGFVLGCFLLLPSSLWAQYEPPQNVTLTMYRLNADGSRISDGNGGYFPCTRADEDIAESYGCTAIVERDVYSYPFSSSVITISIDGSAIVDPDNDGQRVEDNAYTPAQRYLWDVAAQEIGLVGSNGVKPLAGVEAQAIASRTYTYQRILERYTIDNSANLHVFLPYKFETLGQPEKNRLIEAMQRRYFMTPATDNPNTAENEAIYPILAQYGADNREQTTEGILEGKTVGVVTNYLSSVADPINELYGCSNITIDEDGEAQIDYLTNDNPTCGTGNGGMSSKGASRWSYGHTSSQGSVAVDDTRYPGDANRLGNFWSVRWDDALQILTHYYSGVHIRDTNDNNRVVTPERRWVPLRIFGFTTPNETITLFKGQTTARFIEIQNTGIRPWGENSFALSYRPSWNVAAAQTNTAALPNFLAATSPGGTTTTFLTMEVRDDVAPGHYTIGLDTQDYSSTNPGDFEWLSDSGWPQYTINVQVVEAIGQLYLPVILGSATISTQ